MMTESRSYYAVIPASVRYDESLSPNAKLLYAEITALCKAQGYCSAQNNYFSELYHLDKRTISRLISQLSEKGYVKVEVLKDADKKIIGRRIWLAGCMMEDESSAGALYVKTSPGYGQECHEGIDKNVMGYGQNCPQGIDKNVVEYKGRIIQDKNNTPLPPKGNGGVWKDYAGDDGELLQALTDFDRMRTRKKKPMTDRARKLLLTALEKHSGGDRACKLRMLEESVLHCWDTVYPLKDDDPPRGYSQGPKLEEW